MPYTNVWDDTVPLDTQAANQGAADFRQTKLDIMQRVASFGAGTLANRPTPESTSVSANWTGVMYWATDTAQVFNWNGTAWVDITTAILANASVIAAALQTTGAPVNVSLAAPPTTGQILTATNATHATWQTPSLIANALATTGSPVNVSGSAAPSGANNLLITTDATHATWQTLASIQPTFTLKKGSNSGNYTTASGTYVNVDGTNLSYTVTIPVGWKLHIVASGTWSESGGPSSGSVCIADGGTPLHQVELNTTAAGAPLDQAFTLNYVINGDGASHTITLQFFTGGASFSNLVLFNSGGYFPTMSFILSPSN